MTTFNNFFNKTTAKLIVSVNTKPSIEAIITLGKKDQYEQIKQPQNKNNKKIKCFLALPPASCHVRRLTLTNINKKELMSAIKCNTETSLLHQYEDGYIEIKTAVNKDNTSATLFWCKKLFLDNCIHELEINGFEVIGILLPELLIGQETDQVICYQGIQDNHDIISCCYASPNESPIIQTSAAVNSHLATIFKGVFYGTDPDKALRPKQIILWQENSVKDKQKLREFLNNNYNSNCILVENWIQALPYLIKNRSSLKQIYFKDCLQSNQLKRLDLKSALNLFINILITLVVVFCFIFILFSQLEKEINILEKESSKISRAARKSAKATQLIRNLQKKNKLIRNFSQNKPYSLELLKDITEATSTASRLENISIAKDGTIIISGFSKDESHVASMIKKMEESPLLTRCKLIALEHLDENNMYQFSIQAYSKEWNSFFKENSI